MNRSRFTIKRVCAKDLEVGCLVWWSGDINTVKPAMLLKKGSRYDCWYKEKQIEVAVLDFSGDVHFNYFTEEMQLSVVEIRENDKI